MLIYYVGKFYENVKLFTTLILNFKFLNTFCIYVFQNKDRKQFKNYVRLTN